MTLNFLSLTTYRQLGDRNCCGVPCSTGWCHDCNDRVPCQVKVFCMCIIIIGVGVLTQLRTLARSALLHPLRSLKSSKSPF